jgi:hypothetical protein
MLALLNYNSSYPVEKKQANLLVYKVVSLWSATLLPGYERNCRVRVPRTLLTDLLY